MASEIIYRASQDYEINSQVLIALLQKEKGLITKKIPLMMNIIGLLDLLAMITEDQSNALGDLLYK